MVKVYLISEKQSRLFWAVAAIVVCLVILTLGCEQDIANTSEDDLDGFCGSIISIGPDGHYLLNRNAITRENVENINQCIEALAITNVRVASSFNPSRKS